MAQDQVDIMAALGYDRFFLAGHDRVTRTAHPLVLDHPKLVPKVALLDILPTRYVSSNMSREWALNSWHWLFMAQPAEMVEQMMAAIRARKFVMRHLSRLSRPGKPAFFDDRAITENVAVLRAKRSMAPLRGLSCGSRHFDFEHDNPEKAGRNIAAPTLIMWGRRSHTGRFYSGDLLSIWRTEASDVTGGAIHSGHYPSPSP